MTSLILSAAFFIWSIFLNFISQRLIDSKQRLFLFPLFEIIFSLIFLTLQTNSERFLPYFILFSALGITILTDLKSMMISRFTSIFLAPTGLLFSYFNFLPLTLKESLLAAVFSYLSLYLANKVFFIIKKEKGLGEGDMELLTLIGAYTGFAGTWFSTMIGSFIGLFSAIFYMAIKRKQISKLPFGSCLSVGTILYLLFKDQIFKLFL